MSYIEPKDYLTEQAIDIAEDLMAAEDVNLKPCPFCGGEVHRVGGDDDTAHDVECDGCAYTFYDVSVGNGWWNTRPIENALRAEIAELNNRLMLHRRQSLP